MVIIPSPDLPNDTDVAKWDEVVVYLVHEKRVDKKMGSPLGSRFIALFFQLVCCYFHHHHPHSFYLLQPSGDTRDVLGIKPLIGGEIQLY